MRREMTTPPTGIVARVGALGERDQVRRHVPAVDGEPLAAAPEAGHDLVADHHDGVFVAERAHASQIPVRWNQNAIRADHGLEDDRGHRVRALHHEDVGQVLERSLALFGERAGVERRA